MTDLDLGCRPSVPLDEPPYRRFCLRCGAGWPCPTKQDVDLPRTLDQVTDPALLAEIDAWLG